MDCFVLNSASPYTSKMSGLFLLSGLCFVAVPCLVLSLSSLSPSAALGVAKAKGEQLA